MSAATGTVPLGSCSGREVMGMAIESGTFYLGSHDVREAKKITNIYFNGVSFDVFYHTYCDEKQTIFLSISVLFQFDHFPLGSF